MRMQRLFSRTIKKPKTKSLFKLYDVCVSGTRVRSSKRESFCHRQVLVIKRKSVKYIENSCLNCEPSVSPFGPLGKSTGQLENSLHNDFELIFLLHELAFNTLLNNRARLLKRSYRASYFLHSRITTLPSAFDHTPLRFEGKCVFLPIRELPRSFASGSLTAAAITFNPFLIPMICHSLFGCAMYRSKLGGI